MKNNSKNITSVDFWLFVFTVVVAIGNLNNYVWQGRGADLIFTGNKVWGFFIIIAGYFLMEHYKKNKKDAKESAAKSAWEYLKIKISQLYPALLGGVFLAFVVKNVLDDINIIDMFERFIGSIWEFLGLAGFTGLSGGAIKIWNEPLCFFSCILISSLILYFIVSKSEDLFVGLIAPVAIVLGYSYLGSNWPSFMFNSLNGLLRVFVGMCVGMLLYYAVQYFRKKKFNENETMLFSILHIGLAMIIVYSLYSGTPWNEFTNSLILLVFALVILVNKDYISVLYNNSSICGTLGKLSIYYFANHMAFIVLLAKLFPEMGYTASVIFNILYSLCWAFIMMYIDDYVITPIFRSKKVVEENTTKRGTAKKVSSKKTKES